MNNFINEDYLKSCLADMSEARLVCGMPYLMPTPTRGSAFTTFFTAAWSEKANMMDAEIGREEG